MLGLLAKRIAGDDALPLLVSADHHVGLDVKLFRCRTFDQALERCCRSCVALKDGIPALQKCLHALHAETGQELSQI